MRLLLLALLLAVCVGAGFLGDLGSKVKGGVKGVKGVLNKDKGSEEKPKNSTGKTSFGKKVIGIFSKDKKSEEKKNSTGKTSFGKKVIGIFNKDKKSEGKKDSTEKTSFGKKVIGIFTKDNKSEGKPKNSSVKTFGKKIKGVFTGEKGLGAKLKNATSNGFGKKIKGVFTGEKNLVGKIKNASSSVFGKVRSFNRFRGLKGKIWLMLKLAPMALKSLKKRLLNWRPIKRVHIKKQGDSINEINAKSNPKAHLFQGDVALTRQQEDVVFKEIEEEAAGVPRTKRQAYKDKNYPRTLWSEGVNYFFDDSASSKVRSVFVKGAEAWRRDTCIDFRENPNAQDAIRVYKEEGCWSYVGRLGGKQNLSLGDGCEEVGIAAHELGHALGFFHTMSRYDRDQYITVDAQNVEPDWLDQFTMETKSRNDNYGMKYDYGSIMHYGATSSSANEKPTMVPFDIVYQETLGSPFISFIDLSMLNEHYGCKSKCDPKKSAKCQQGGFPHPRDCSRCICPGGYGGKLCNERPAGCGKILQASSNFETLSDIVGKGGEVEEDFVTCNYWIQSPAGTNIEVKLLSFPKGVAMDGCPYAGVEIKTNKDQTLTGYRFCAPEDAGVVLKSYSNLVPIITYNRIARTQTVLQYRYVTAGGTKGL